MTTPPRLIKRYQNRKLYDTTESCYVTLEEIADIVRSGEEIRVVDNSNQDDLTSVTLAQIIFESEKNQRNFLPIDTLKKLVQSGGEVVRDFVQRSIESGVKEISHVRDEVVDFADRLVHTGSIRADEKSNVVHSIRKFIATTVKPTVKSMQSIPAVNHELKALKKRIEELEGQLSQKKKKS